MKINLFINKAPCFLTHADANYKNAKITLKIHASLFQKWSLYFLKNIN